MRGRIVLAGLLAAGAAATQVMTPASAFAEVPRIGRLLAPRDRDPAGIDDSLLGRSGKLRARFLPMAQASELERALGVFRAVANTGGTRGARIASLRVLPIIPFAFKQDGWVGMYRMGFWPGEQRAARSRAYENPTGFIEVTPQNLDLRVSEHFRLGQFVTKDQFTTWPKFVVLREALLDKLELVIEELGNMGYAVGHLQVMSGFRHPFYNAQGVGKGGRARESRHMFGDAADVFVDNDGDGMLDDLDGDGRVTVYDIDLIILAVERVERQHPELTGGMGRYHGTNAHGPFVHIDVRGTAARWGGA